MLPSPVHNFLLFKIFAGANFIYCLSRQQMLDEDNCKTCNLNMQQREVLKSSLLSILDQFLPSNWRSYFYILVIAISSLYVYVVSFEHSGHSLLILVLNYFCCIVVYLKILPFCKFYVKLLRVIVLKHQPILKSARLICC